MSSKKIKQSKITHFFTEVKRMKMSTENVFDNSFEELMYHLRQSSGCRSPVSSINPYLAPKISPSTSKKVDTIILSDDSDSDLTDLSPGLIENLDSFVDTPIKTTSQKESDSENEEEKENNINWLEQYLSQSEIQSQVINPEENTRIEQLYLEITKKLSAIKDSKGFVNKPMKKKKTRYVRRFKRKKMKIYKLQKIKPVKSKPTINTNLEYKLKEMLGIPTDLESSQSASDRAESPSSSLGSEERKGCDSSDEELKDEDKQKFRNSVDAILNKQPMVYKSLLEDEVLQDEEILWKVNEILLKVINGKVKKFKHPRICWENCVFEDGRLQLKPLDQCKYSIVTRRTYILMLYVLHTIKVLLDHDSIKAKRQIYYELCDMEVVKHQHIINRVINCVSMLLGVGPWALHLVSQKGRIYGPIQILFTDNETLNCNIQGGELIPLDISSISEIQTNACFIMVVEKETVFSRLIEEDLPNKLARPFILITGKGYPDQNTQLFIKKMSKVLCIPIFILTDADPHGIALMLNYKCGSLQNMHLSQHLALPEIKWLGVYPSELIRFAVTTQPLKKGDFVQIENMLKHPHVRGNKRVIKEIEILRDQTGKAEIEGIMKNRSFLSDFYLPLKFFNNEFA